MQLCNSYIVSSIGGYLKIQYLDQRLYNQDQNHFSDKHYRQRPQSFQTVETGVCVNANVVVEPFPLNWSKCGEDRTG